MILIESKRKKIETIRKAHPDALIMDATSHADTMLVKLSPFYPHGGIPVPFTKNMTATCVEAIWQGLKVFETCDVDVSLFKNDTMKNIKRTVRKYGRPLGHRKGVYGTELLGYVEARKQIYIPTYKWMLENKAADVVDFLKQQSEKHTVVLLDYDTNGDIEATRKPLSHAALVKAYIEGIYPYGDKTTENKQSDKPEQLSLF